MSKYIVDSYAWIEYFEGSEQGRVLQKLLQEKNEVITHTVTLAEIISRMKRKGRDPDKVFEAIAVLSKLEETDPLFAKEVGLIHANLRQEIKDFGLADAYVLVLAKKHHAKIITGDPHFKGMPNVIFLG